MYSLTDNRWLAIEPICDTYAEVIRSSGSMDCNAFESDLCSALNIGFLEVKDLAPQIAKKKPYEKVAVYYMIYWNGPGPTDTHKSDIAKYPGIPSYDHSVERDAAIKEYFK